MHQHIAGSEVRVIPRAGHYSPWEQPELAHSFCASFWMGWFKILIFAQREVETRHRKPAMVELSRNAWIRIVAP